MLRRRRLASRAPHLKKSLQYQSRYPLCGRGLCSVDVCRLVRRKVGIPRWRCDD